MATRIAILGGGMAGLTAAWHLTEPGCDNEVTIYQRGGRLGGKGASSRGVNGRIEEHGFHVWLGHYDNAFRLLRACYSELDRTANDPSCPIRTWRDAFRPANYIGIAEEDEEGWSPWMSRFPDDGRVPGEPDADGTTDLGALTTRLVSLVGRLGTSMLGAQPAPRAVLSTRPDLPRPGIAEPPLAELVAGARDAFTALAVDGRARRRTAQFADFLGAVLRGVVADGMVGGRWSDLDDDDISDWLRRHGADEATIAGPWVRGLHDLAFAYEDADPTKARFPAGLGLFLASKAFVDYKGALFWKMTAGMGDVVIAPLYQALRARGVRFRFFHRLDRLHLDASGRTLDGVVLAEQVGLRTGVDEYDPLVRVNALPVFPDRVDLGQLDADESLLEHDLESHYCTWPEVGEVHLERGRDFDEAILAVSVGMLPYVAGELIAADERWAAMIANIKTVATRAVQLWLDPDERDLGSRYPTASVTGLGHGFDTFSSMSHTLAHETWPAEASPRTAISLCSVLPEELIGSPDDPGYVERATAGVRTAAVTFLEERAGDLWPSAVADGHFDWSLLTDEDGRDGEDRLEAQYWRANVDPSDRYVQAAPGTGRFRIRPDDSGFEHLVIAGDWTDNGVNVGCIEAAVVSGVQAANAAQGRSLLDGVSFWRPQNRRTAPRPSDVVTAP